jgi:hypothetical protein
MNHNGNELPTSFSIIHFFALLFPFDDDDDNDDI